MAKPAGHKTGCGCVICARGRVQKTKTRKAAKRPRANKPAGHKKGCGCVICLRTVPKATAKKKARSNSARFRSGARVVVKANAAARQLYAGLPANGTEGVVVAVPVGQESKSFMPGPGGGLNFVRFSSGKVMGVSPRDLVAAPPRAKPKSRQGHSSPCCNKAMRHASGTYTCPCGQAYIMER